MVVVVVVVVVGRGGGGYRLKLTTKMSHISNVPPSLWSLDILQREDGEGNADPQDLYPTLVIDVIPNHAT